MREVRITHGFWAQLRDIEQFLDNTDAGHVADALIDELLNRIVPTLRAHPQFGRAYALSAIGTLGLQHLLEQLPKHADFELREYIRGDFLLLYANLHGRTELLAIRHHRQSAYWPSGTALNKP